MLHYSDLNDNGATDRDFINMLKRGYIRYKPLKSFEYETVSQDRAF